MSAEVAARTAAVLTRAVLEILESAAEGDVHYAARVRYLAEAKPLLARITAVVNDALEEHFEEQARRQIGETP